MKPCAECAAEREATGLDNIWCSSPECYVPDSQPVFEHDCENCVFIDTMVSDSYYSGDVYVCEQGGFPTVIIRFGDDGPDYGSSDRLVRKLPEDLRHIAKAQMRHWRRHGDWSRERMRSRRTDRRALRRQAKSFQWDLLPLIERGITEPF